MDQAELRKLESRCIQEQPPGCVTACPLHVDVRTFVHHMSEGKWDLALKILHKTLPCPGILGRICDAPCERHCKRSEAGGAILIGALERFCVSQLSVRRLLPPRPAKEQKIAVVGTGLSGLTAAWDLSRKGYGVALFQSENPVSYFLNRYPGLLSETHIADELAFLEKMGVLLHHGIEINSPQLRETCRTDSQAVFLCLETADPFSWGLKISAEDIHDFQTTNQKGVFAGGRGNSPVFQGAEGRWGATSIDRYLQKVSMTAGREKEKPYKTRLYTRMEGVRSQQPTLFSRPDGRYTDKEARVEASRCLHCECLECVKVCAYLDSFKSYPRKYAREIYNNESIVMGSRLANKLINSCSLCGLCERVCPEGFPMQDLCLTARQSMVRRGKMPPSAHEFALLDMAFSQSEHFRLVRNEPGRHQSDYAFLPGCQLAATRPRQTMAVYEHLRHHAKNGVGLMLGCCGAPARWAGNEALFQEQLTLFQEGWHQLGEPKIVAACATCLLMLRQNLPKLPSLSLWEIFNNIDLPEPAFRPRTPPAIHDPCTSRDDTNTQLSVRGLLNRLNVSFTELALGRDKTECCGFGGLMHNANPNLAREVIRRRANQSNADYLTYCAMCRDSLAAVGKRAIHILDLFFPRGESDPAEIGKVKWSRRQENRARLKEELLRHIWKEESPQMAPHEEIALKMSVEVRERLDQRRILDDDIRRVIHHARETGNRLYHPDTGHCKASFKPYKTTFWVEYTPVSDGYEIHNAYAHRMDVVDGGHL